MVAKVSTLLGALFLALYLGSAQKIVKKTLIKPESRAFQIDASNCFQVQLRTSNTDEIIIVAAIDGEYQKDLLVGVEEDGSNVLVSAGFQPNFRNPNDKLSTHKVISIALDILLPELVDVDVFGTNANIIAEGSYRQLEVNLSDGNCRLQDIGETIRVKTQKGNIFLTTTVGEVDAHSHYGNVRGETIPIGENLYLLRSVEGNIHIERTK